MEVLVDISKEIKIISTNRCCSGLQSDDNHPFYSSEELRFEPTDEPGNFGDIFILVDKQG
jgi:hypothetical protein